MATNAPAETNPELVIRKIGESITIFSTPFARGGVVPFGGRSTAIVLKDNTTWLIPSTPLDSATLQTLSALPPIAHLVSPDLEHHLYLKSYLAAYPDAKVYVPSSVAAKWKKDGAKEVDRISFIFGEGKGDPFEGVSGGEIKCADFGKAFVNEDVAFLHAPTKTLIEADLLFNLPCHEQVRSFIYAVDSKL
ncbi:hypothetical protein P7C70_g2925, partial [Phenoliferia sp. Uapishka_3]